CASTSSSLFYYRRRSFLRLFFIFIQPVSTVIYTLSLHDALPILVFGYFRVNICNDEIDRIFPWRWSMVKRRFSKEWLFYIVLILCLPAIHNDVTYASSSKSFVYDEANILTDEEIAKLDLLEVQYSEKRETEFIILTTNDTDGKDIEQYLQDFYDANAPGYDRPHGNAAILALDVDVREVYVAGFYHAEKYLDNDRIDSLLDQITPDLSDEQYYEAFQSFITISNRYMGFKPGIDPEFIFFKWWFQLLVSIGVGALIVKMMLRHTGG